MPGAPLHIVFCGTSAFAAPSLRALSGDPRFMVDAVITQPDRPVGRAQTLTPPPVKVIAQELHIPLLQPENLKRAFATLGLPRPDFLVVVSYGQILSQEILAWPKMAPVNVHASLLPRWRGASPLQHAVLTGDETSGVTIQRMAEALDAGPVLSQREVTLDPRETMQTLHDRLADIGAMLLVETLSQPLQETEQDTSKVTLCPKLTRADGLADAQTMTAQSLDRRVRALTPWPGVTIEIDGGPLKLLETDLTPRKNSAPLPCAEGSILHLVTVQPAGKKPMDGAAWARGKRSS